MEIKKKKREEGVEVLRCILMFGICLIHATAYSTDRCWWLGNIANCSVAAFVFISGWYGIKCRLGKIINMVCMALWCAVVAVALNGFVPDEVCMGGGYLVAPTLFLLVPLVLYRCYVVCSHYQQGIGFLRVRESGFRDCVAGVHAGVFLELDCARSGGNVANQIAVSRRIRFANIPFACRDICNGAIRA